MYGFGRSTRSRNVNIWPGFVDGLATILLVVIFVLLVFLAGQFFLSLRLSGREAQLERLNSQIDELAELLSVERQINADLGLTIGRMSEDLRGSQAERDALAARVGALDAERIELDRRLQSALLENSQLSESQARLDEERRTLQGALEESASERARLGAGLSALEAERESLRAEIGALSRQRLTMKQQIESLDAERGFLASTLEASEQEAARLSESLTAVGLERDALQGEVSALTQVRERLTASLQAVETQLAELLERIRQVQEERGRLTAELEQLNQVRAELTEALESSGAERDDLLEEVASLGRALNDSERERAALLDSLSDSEAQRAAQAQRLVAAEEREATLEAALAALRAEREELTSRLSESEGQSSALAERIAGIESEAAGLAAELGLSPTAGGTLEALLEGLRAELSRARAERDSLTEQVTRLTGDNLASNSALQDALDKIEADRETIAVQLGEIAALTSLRDELQARIASLDAARRAELGEKDAEIGRLREQLATSGEESAAFEALSKEAEERVVLLNQQLAALRRQLGDLNAALEAAETLNREQEAQIIDLGRRLNVALATKVQELARYRSEFFGRLREVLGDTAGIQIVGDRFVFQSEVLFETAEADLEPEGRAQLEQLARTLIEVGQRIPEDIDWVLRVDGHTDSRPIATARFPSNWELSSARALSVVRYLIAQGIPAERLVAAGFGQFQPIAEGDDPDSLRRNRRIEMKLTQR